MIFSATGNCIYWLKYHVLPLNETIKLFKLNTIGQFVDHVLSDGSNILDSLTLESLDYLIITDGTVLVFVKVFERLLQLLLLQCLAHVSNVKLHCDLVNEIIRTQQPFIPTLGSLITDIAL